MKKSILLFTAVFSAAVIFSGCNQTEEAPSELDKLLEQVRTTHLTSDTPAGEDGVETSSEDVTYKSVTGILVSFSEKNITVKADNEEHKFLIDGSTQILGGELSSAEAVTVTYGGDDGEKDITAEVITVLDTNGAGEESAAETSDSESGETVTDLPELTEPEAPEINETADSSDTAVESDISDSLSLSDSTDVSDVISETTAFDETQESASDTAEALPEETAEQQTAQAEQSDTQSI